MVNSGLLFLAHLCMQDIHSKHLREFLHQRLTILQFTFPSSQDMGLQGTGEADTPTGLIQALPGGLPKSKLLSSRSAVSDSVSLTPWTAACQASLSFPISRSKAEWNKQRSGFQLLRADFQASLSPRLSMYKMGKRCLLKLAAIISKIIQKLADGLAPRKHSIKRCFFHHDY